MTEDIENRGFSLLAINFSDLLIELLMDIFDKYHKVEQKGFFTSFGLTSFEDKRMIDKEIKNAISDGILKEFPDYDILVSNFVIKYPGNDSFLPLHRDWSVVDEQKHKSISLWIPLVDVTTKNGALGFVPKSHLNASEYRGPSNVDSLYAKNEVDEVEYIPMKKGQVMAFYPSTLHASNSNLNSKVRVAITAVVVPKNAVTYHYYFPNGSNSLIEAFKVDSNFFLKYSLGDKMKNRPAYVLKNGKKRINLFNLFQKE